MPYKKYNTKKRSRASKAYYHGKNVADIAGKALRVAYYTKKMLNVEYKVIDNVLNATPITVGSVFDVLNSIAQGTSNTSREGDQIKVTSIFMKYYISQNTSATDTNVRVIMILDRQSNGTSIPLASVLQNTAVSASIVSPLNLDSKFRIKVLYDRVHQMSINGKRNIYAKKYIKFPIKVRYSTNTGTFTDIQSNLIKIFFLSDEATNTPDLESFIRVRFVDN